MDIESIQAKVKDGKYIISFSHTEKIRQRKITAKEIEDTICEGTIIEPGMGRHGSRHGVKGSRGHTLICD